MDGGEAKELAGALIGLFKADTENFTEENALLTYTTAEDGAFVFEGIPYGHWIVAEIAAPELYTISPERHHVYIGTDGQVIEIRIDNTLIRGSVQVIKTEAVSEPSAVKSDNDNTFLRFLTGAVFDLYADTNGNKELDGEDRLIGQLTETDGGYHTAENLLYGGYFVKESKAPEGYKIDENAYYFAITEDGQVAVIENGETGRGFSNEAYRGNLKIVKDSSDRRKDGFAIEVKSADGTYCETFTTPENGIIEVNGLRIGIYTVTEISNRASRDYIIPDAATVEIKADETATVQLFNEKPEGPAPEQPTTPGKPVPQTGDDNFIFLWGGLLLVAVIGGALFIILRSHKGKHVNWLDNMPCRPYRTEVQLYKALMFLKRSIDRDLIITSQREALQTLRCIISNIEYRFYKAYGMEIEDKRTVYEACAYQLVPREDEPSVCLMHEWIYLPSA